MDFSLIHLCLSPWAVGGVKNRRVALHFYSGLSQTIFVTAGAPQTPEGGRRFVRGIVGFWSIEKDPFRNHSV